MTIWTAPIRALYSLDFYRKVTRSSLGQGFAYLFYLAAILALVFSVWFVSFAGPKMDAFVEWLKGDMPTFVLKPEGLSMDKTSPYTMTHSQFGLLATFDMTKTDVTQDQLGGSPVFVTSTKIYAHHPQRNELRVYDLVSKLQSNAKAQPRSLEVNPEVLGKFYAQLKPWIFVLVSFFVFLFLVIGNLIGALIHSLVGLLMNAFRVSKLAYSAVLNVSFFAMTLATLIQSLQWFVPVLNRVPLGFFGNLFITAIYLFIGIKLTEPHEEKPAS